MTDAESKSAAGAWKGGEGVMRKHPFAPGALAVLLSIVTVALLRAQPPAALERHEFVIRNFHTESGVVLPEARVVYSTLGTLNAAATTPSCCRRTTWRISTATTG